MIYYLYIIKSKIDGSYYVGQTNDIVDRIDRHNKGRNKYTKNKIPWELKYTEKFDTRSKSVKRELEIKKKKSKRYIEWLIGK